MAAVGVAGEGGVAAGEAGAVREQQQQQQQEEQRVMVMVFMLVTVEQLPALLLLEE